MAAGAFALALVLLAALAAMRGWRRWRQSRVAQRERVWLGVMDHAIADPAAAALPPVSRLDLPDFLLLWNRVRRPVEDAAADNLAQLLHRHGIDERALRLLVLGSLRSRLIAMTTLGYLREERAWARLERLARRPNPVISFAAARAMLRIEPRRALDALAASIVQRDDWSVARIGSIFAELGAATVTPTLTTMLIARARVGLGRVVKLARFGDRGRVAPIVRGWLSATEEPDIIMAALDYVEDARELPWAMSAAQHAEWRVRMAAAKALGRIGGATEIPALIELLRDPVWWVRYHAASAVTGLQGMTPEELEVVRENARDSFASDMLAHAFAELPVRRNKLWR